ncbi:ATPase AAA [Achromatium sp. WMS3]|nr:ATPase AAA [Achromatium sp. WMS3]
MRFPYGICDFFTLINEQYYYADRSDRIGILENAGHQLLFLRPRRFGKSLLLSMLDNYYDIAKTNQFTNLFGQLKIGQAPTPRHNQYFILRWDFSMVKSYGTVQEIEAALHEHLNAAIHYFSIHYESYITRNIVLQKGNGITSLYNVAAAISDTPYKLYLLIDEYDNFANEVMTAQPKDYAALVHGQGIMKTVFKAVKGLSAGQGIDRVFITGVSPVVMSDISSGYNVSKNISLRPEYNDLCGFHEEEIAKVLQQVGHVCHLTQAQITEALEMMRTFYNGYRFNEDAQKLVYNPTLALYFLDNFNRDCKMPKNMLDDNLAMDRNRIKYIASLPHGQKVVEQALDPQNPLIISKLADRFGVEDMLYAVKDQPFMASLLYYLGVLTIDAQDMFGEITLRIPNLVIQRLYIERLQESFLPTYEDIETVRSAARQFYQTGNLQPLCTFMEDRYFAIYDNRDYRFSNELVIKTAFLILLFSDLYYIMDSETAIARQYTDLSMILRPDMRRYQLLDHLLEFKYLSLQDLGLSGAKIKPKPVAELLAIPLVSQKLDEAEQQLQIYRQTLEATYGAKLRLHTHAVVALGFDRLVWRSTAVATI